MSRGVQEKEALQKALQEQAALLQRHQAEHAHVCGELLQQATVAAAIEARMAELLLLVQQAVQRQVHSASESEEERCVIEGIDSRLLFLQHQLQQLQQHVAQEQCHVVNQALRAHAEIEAKERSEMQALEDLAQQRSWMLAREVELSDAREQDRERAKEAIVRSSLQKMVRWSRAAALARFLLCEHVARNLFSQHYRHARANQDQEAATFVYWC